MKIIPVGENYLIKLVVERKETKPGVLIIPDKDQQTFYEIVAAYKDSDLPIGSKILIHKYHGQEVQMDGKDYLIIKKDDIVAIVED